MQQQNRRLPPLRAGASQGRPAIRAVAVTHRIVLVPDIVFSASLAIPLFGHCSPPVPALALRPGLTYGMMGGGGLCAVPVHRGRVSLHYGAFPPFRLGHLIPPSAPTLPRLPVPVKGVRIPICSTLVMGGRAAPGADRGGRRRGGGGDGRARGRPPDMVRQAHHERAGKTTLWEAQCGASGGGGCTPTPRPGKQGQARAGAGGVVGAVRPRPRRRSGARRPGGSARRYRGSASENGGWPRRGAGSR